MNRLGTMRKWSRSTATYAALALVMGCGATDELAPAGENETETESDGYRRSGGLRHEPRAAQRGQGRGHSHGKGHGHGKGHHHHGPGHHHGPECSGSGGAGSGVGGSGTGTAGSGPGTGGGATAGTGSSAGGSGGAGDVGGSSGSGGTGVGGWGGGYYEPVCGDRQTMWPEQCDDGNTSNGDGCSSTCVLDEGFFCDYEGLCHPVECGNGVQESAGDGNGNWTYEWCDDGNAVSGDGCTDVCTPEPWFTCEYPGEPCRQVVCGDGSQDWYLLPGSSGGGGAGGTSASGGTAGTGGGGPGYVYGYEGCDDGNSVSGDGCSDSCDLEAGYVCDSPGVPCRIPTCGDGHIDYIYLGGGGSAGSAGSGGSGWGGTGSGAYGGYAGTGPGGSYYVEECDDGNVVAADGCDAVCTIEEGYSCQQPGLPCKLAECGDGVWDYPAEECEDGNRVSGDGCSSDCEGEYIGSGGFGGSVGAGGSGTWGGYAGQPATGGSAGSSGSGG